jgi:signal transduction histidine kinase
VVVLVNALVLGAYRLGRSDHPGWTVVALGVMVVWTGVAIGGYRSRTRRTAPLLVADLGITVALLLASPWLTGEDMTSTVPGFWVMGAMLAWAICWRVPGGAAAAVVLAGGDLLVRAVLTDGPFTEATNGNIFLLLIGGPIVGYMCEQLYRSAAQRDRAERAAAAAAERARLARAVHDGVLQVLALVQRRGAETRGADPALAELGRMAGEQEAALRALIRREDTDAGSATGGVSDLAARLQRWESQPSPRTEVAAPAVPVTLPDHVVEEVDAAVGQCLSNVRHHVGADARAWVLVEDLGERVAVSVRDEGPGIPEGRLEQAATDGRLGVAESIRGRIGDLGGRAAISTGTWGTEWELEVPR